MDSSGKREINSSMASRGWVENRCDICASFGCDMSLDMSRRIPPEPWMSRPLMSWFGSWMMFIEHFCSLGMSAWRVANIWLMSSQLKHLTYQPPQKELNQYNPDGIQHAFNTGRFFLFPSLDVHRNKISGEKSYLLQCHSRRCKNWFRMRGVSFLIERRCYQPMRLHL